MATFKKMRSGRWQAQVARGGVRSAKSFRTKQEAKDWASRREYLIAEGDDAIGTGTLGDLFRRYAREVSPNKRGARWETIRFELLCRDRLTDVTLRELKPAHFADWRDRRLRSVSPGTVNREMVLMSAALSVARKEWGILKVNPISDVRKPSKPPPRDRRVSDAEVDLLLRVAGDNLAKKSVRAIHAFRFAIETGMRAGEIVGMEWERVHLDRRFVHLLKTKNGTSRSVPLSTAAVALLEALKPAGGRGSCFNLSSAQLDALFRKVRDAAKITGLRFHDSRHEAITRLSTKLDVLSLARMVGHRDIRMLQVYYNATAEELALRLN